MKSNTVKVDLHCHSKFSNVPSTWFHEWVKTGECYTSPQEVYRVAKKKGMDFVTITDHDTIRGALELMEKHPKDSFISVEVTAFFPEDGAKVHVLVWDLSENQFREIDQLRTNLYELQAYLNRNRLPHSLAHASYNMDGKLTMAHLEKLVLLFDTFEGRNGGRSSASNLTWLEYLVTLNPDVLSDLSTKHRLAPANGESWIKAITGGSDDHSGLFIGDTYTQTPGSALKDFFEGVAQKKSSAHGDHSTMPTYTYGALKIAHEFAGHAKGNYTDSHLGKAVEYFFTSRKLSLLGRFKLSKLKKKLAEKETEMGDAYLEFLLHIQAHQDLAIKEKIDKNYEALGRLADAYFKRLMRGLIEDPKKGQLLSMMKHLSAIFPHLALVLPFVASASHLYSDQPLLAQIKKQTRKTNEVSKEKLLWFTDTLEDLNGVSETLRKIASVSLEEGLALKLVAGESVKIKKMTNLLRLPLVDEIEMPYYTSQKIVIPSLLTSLKKIIEEEPTSIVISTPGPVGWLGFLAAKILRVPVSAVYHTDFTSQAKKIIGDETLADVVESVVHFFYRQMDTIWVPTQSYMKELSTRGLDLKRMKLFRRGIDTSLFQPDESAKEKLITRHPLIDAPILLYAGRISEDKNLEMLTNVYRELVLQYGPLNLILAGDGPTLSTLKGKMKDQPNVVFTGRVERDELPTYYAGSDLLVFPSATDTFGMVVLEAQACGLPCVVNELGGPKEIIKNGETGWVVRGQDEASWLHCLQEILEKQKQDVDLFKNFGLKAREYVLQNSTWPEILPDFFKDCETHHQSSELSTTPMLKI